MSATNPSEVTASAKRARPVSRALSVSRSVWERIRAGHFSGRVTSVYPKACTLVAQDGSILALVRPSVGNGPCNIVVQSGSAFSGIASGMPVDSCRTCLEVGGTTFDLGQATIWEARPDWRGLQARKQAACDRIPTVLNIARASAPRESMCQILLQPYEVAAVADRAYPLCGAVHTRAAAGARLLRAGWAGEPGLVEEGVTHLAGLGRGLTPAGDDFLAGVMLGAWLAHPDPTGLCESVLRVAAPRTTTLSAAYLRAASRGECSEAWHMLLGRLVDDSAVGLESAVHRVLSFGATSGADTLAGFVWAGTISKPGHRPCLTPLGAASPPTQDRSFPPRAADH